MLLKSLFLSFAYLSIVSIAIGQMNTEYFSPLSAGSYSQKIAELKARSVPIIFTEKKEQKTYAEIINERNKSIVDALEQNRIVYDTMLLNKCKAIIEKIKVANMSFSFNNISFYINRSCIANASCYGEGSLFINLGLFLWIDNDDEMALIIGHELSHQFLNHADSKIKKDIALLSSDDFINEIRAIKKSSNGKYERYKNLMKELVVQNGTHSRYKESEADSLGLALIKNAGYNIKNAANILLKLDHVDDLFDANDLYTVKEVFEKVITDSFMFKKNNKYHGLSMALVTMNADKDFDSVKTHPDCIARYTKLTGIAATQPVINCCTSISTGYAAFKERALVELIRYEYEINRLTLCAHLCLFAIKNGYTSSFYSYFLSLSFSGIYAADKKFERFSATDSKAKTGSSLKVLQDFIFNANSTNIAEIAAWFLNNTPNKSSDDYLFASLMYNSQVKLSDASGLQKNFTAHFPNSKYAYLLNSLKH